MNYKSILVTFFILFFGGVKAMNASDLTFAMIKPDSYSRGVSGDIISIIEKNGFEIVAMKSLRLTEEKAKNFYFIHKDKPFYNDLVSFMTSGKIVAIVLKKDNAVEAFRNLIGDTDPKKAKEQTIRNLYGSNIENNAVHGSDSNENAAIEISFFFAKMDIDG